MPWSVKHNYGGCSGWAVVKDSDGKVVPGGCHGSKSEAEAHQRALYAAEKAVSDNHEKVAMKRENGIDYPARDFAYVPDPMRPTTWRLRLTDAPGKVSAAQLGRAAAALSPGGFRGNRVEIPSSALRAVKRRIRAEYRKLGIDERQVPASVKESAEHGTSLTIWKDAQTSRHRWLAIYSNNFRDNDRPSEIITEASHRRFVKMIEDGQADYPEVWLWHTPGTAWGKADMVDYVDGFAMATGYVYEGMESVAVGLAKMADLAVSHGMPRESIRYEPPGSSYIVEHATIEISPLPFARAANKFTSFKTIETGEQPMGLQPEKRQFLLEAGLSEEAVELLESNIKSMGDLAAGLGIESKEEDAPEDAQTEPEAEPGAEEPVAEAEPAAKEETEPELEAEPVAKEEGEDAPEAEPVAVPAYVTQEELAEVVAQIVAPFGAVVQSLTQQLQETKAALKQANDNIAALERSDEEKLADLKEQTPSLSIAEIIANSVLGKEASKVDGRSALGKDAPAEKEWNQESVTPSSFLDGLMMASRKNGA